MQVLKQEDYYKSVLSNDNSKKQKVWNDILNVSFHLIA